MNLDPQQTEAVTAPLVNCSVLAGAGSGKTRVIIERIHHIITQYGIYPRNILAITYTRKAAQEMRERIKERIGKAYRKITLTTIHSFCHLQLYRFGDKLGWNPETMSVFSEDESRKMLDFTLDELGYIKGGKFKKKKDGPGKKMVDKAFNLLGSHGEWPEDEDVKMIMTTFFRNCKSSNVMTYNMIITEFYKLIEIPEVLQLLRDEYHHIIVDEVQDTSVMQWNIVNKLKAESIYCCGDERQNIMSFGGSDIKNTLYQTKEYAKYTIQNNYRSAGKIVEEGNRIMSEHVPMIQTIESEGAIETIYSTSEDVKKILYHVLKLGYEFEDIFLLCRTHRPLAKSVAALRAVGADIYYPKEFDTIDKHPHTTVIHAFLSLQLNPYDLFSFLIVAEFLELGVVETQEIKTEAISKSMSYPEAYFYVIGEHMKLNCDVLNREVMIEVLDNLAEFDYPHPQDISEYFKWRAQKDLQFHQEDVPDGKIQALSVHQAKGLQSKVVILIGVSEGIMPSSFCRSDEDIEEEKRLYYVAATRAIDLLIISPRTGKDPSRFLK